MNDERKPLEAEPISAEARLANRATLLTFASLCAFLLALLAMPLTFQNTDRAGPRIAASAPLVLGVGTGLLARAARARLGALRGERRDGGGAQELAPGAPTGASPTADRGV